MDINQIRTEKEKMENYLQRMISQTIETFVEQTGIRVEYINIYMVNVTTLSDYKPKFTVGRVEVELEQI